MAKGERCHLTLNERETVCRDLYERHLGGRPVGAVTSAYRKLCKGVRIGL